MGFLGIAIARSSSVQQIFYSTGRSRLSENVKFAEQSGRHSTSRRRLYAAAHLGAVAKSYKRDVLTSSRYLIFLGHLSAVSRVLATFSQRRERSDRHRTWL